MMQRADGGGGDCWHERKERPKEKGKEECVQRRASWWWRGEQARREWGWVGIRKKNDWKMAADAGDGFTAAVVEKRFARTRIRWQLEVT